MSNRLIVVCMDLPGHLEEAENLRNQKISSSNGLVSMIYNGYKNLENIIFVGMGKQLDERFVCVCCPSASFKLHQGYCREKLLPLLNYSAYKNVYLNACESGLWDGYVKLNQCFAESIMKILQENDIVWIQDIGLLLLPSMLRKSLPSSVFLALFFHSNFPSSEVFKMIPERRNILEGMLGCDLIGFQVYILQKL